jgi:hypothetical protein
MIVYMQGCGGACCSLFLSAAAASGVVLLPAPSLRGLFCGDEETLILL